MTIDRTRTGRRVIAIEDTHITHADGTKTPITIALVADPRGGYTVEGYDEPIDLPAGASLAVHFTPPPP